jgi:uncharacterized alkaline shock family protein YloU
MTDKQILNKISEGIIGNVAMNAALGVKGVNKLADNLADNITKKIVGKDDIPAGIKVSKVQNAFVIDIFLIANYGVKIPQLAWDVQKEVKKSVSKVTGESVSAVNIHVQGIRLPDKSKEIHSR